MKEKLYKTISEAGDVLNFSIVLYNNEMDPERTKLAKRTAKKFIEGFAKFCEEEGLRMDAGLTELPSVGSCGYVSVNKGNDALMMMAVPHDVIEITNSQKDEK